MENTENGVLMTKARESLTGKWGLAIATFFIFELVMSIGGMRFYLGHGVSIIPNIIPLIFGGPLTLGAAVFSLSISRI